MKKLLFLMIALLVGLTGFSQSSIQFKTTNQTNSHFNQNQKPAKGVVDSLHYDGAQSLAIGTNSAGSFGCYSYWPTDSLSGYDGKVISQVKLYIDGATDVNSAQIELRYDQSSDPVMTQEFEPVEGWNMVDLINPIQIQSTQDFYIGYFIDVSGGYPAGCDEGPIAANGNGNWMILGGEWDHLHNLGDGLNYNWNLRAIVAETEAIDMAIESVDLGGYTTDTVHTINGVIKNFGDSTIHSFDITYQINDAPPVSYSITDTTIPSWGTYEFSHPQTWIASEGQYNVEVSISNLNAGDDNNTANNSITKQVTIVPYFPEKKVFGEQATGTWCGWCVRGHVYMDSMYHKYPDSWIGVAVHNGDPMVNTTYDGAIGNYIGGYPSGLVDRGSSIDPSQFETDYLNQIDKFSPGNLTIQIDSINEETNEVTLTANSEFVVKYANLRFNAVISEDSVTGTSSGYDQVNYYAGGNYGPMAGYEDMPNPVPAEDMVYRHVAREILGGWDGTPNSLPDTVLTDETHSYTYTTTLSDDWNLAQLKFIGLLIDQNTGRVLNANSTYYGSPVSYDVTFNVTDGTEPLENASITLNDTTIITNADGEASIALTNGTYEYTAMHENFVSSVTDEFEIAGSDVTIPVEIGVGVNQINATQLNIYPNPSKGIFNIEVDGNYQLDVMNQLGQVVYSKEVSDETKLNLKALEKGIYFVAVRSDNQTTTQKILIE